MLSAPDHAPPPSDPGSRRCPRAHGGPPRATPGAQARAPAFVAEVRLRKRDLAPALRDRAVARGRAVFTVRAGSVLAVALLPLGLFLAPSREASAHRPAALSEPLIAFARTQDGTGRIAIVRPDGSRPRVVTKDAGNEHPAWSPDGRWLAFVSGGDVSGTEIEVARVDGTGRRRLTHRSGFDGDPAWSPLGRRIAWAASRGGHLDVWTMDADGRHQRRLTGSSGGAHPSWSPDGRWVAYVAPMSGALEVAAARGGRPPRRLAALAASRGPSAPSWSPDGRRIAFVGADGGLYTVAPDGRALRRLLVGTPRAGAAFPAWSPRGATIAVLEGPRGSLLTVAAEGGRRRRLAPRTDGLSAPSWSPAGTRIAFADAGQHIVIVGADGRGRRQLTRGVAGDDNPSWRPHHPPRRSS
jgi:TolB protein